MADAVTETTEKPAARRPDAHKFLPLPVMPHTPSGSMSAGDPGRSKIRTIGDGKAAPANGASASMSSPPADGCVSGSTASVSSPTIITS